MEKRGRLMVLALILLFVLPTVFSSSAEEEMKKLANYAQEYEIGNIDYVQLLLHISSVRQSLNELLGATEKEMGGVLKQEQIKSILGEPTEETKWVWVENEERERKLDKAVPAWQKIVFDGKKIQIKLNAWPSLFKKKQFKEFMENNEKTKIKEEYEESEEKLIYRLHFEIIFKKPEEQLDIDGKIKEIQTLAQNFNSAPTNENAEALAKESVNAERTFEFFFRQKQEKCEDVMKSIFGAENQRATQKMFVQEFSLYSEENFEIITRIEMCDDCEWNWIYMESRLEGRGKFKMPKETGEAFSPQEFKNLDFEDFKEEIKKAVDELKQVIESKNYAGIYRINSKIRALNEAWNQKSNEVWKEIEQKSEIQNNIVVENQISENNQNNNVIETTGGDSNNNIVDDDMDPGLQGIVGDGGGDNIAENTVAGKVISSITGNAVQETNVQPEQKDPYYWIKQDQERRKQERLLRKENYEKRKQFYLDLFFSYEKKEYYFEQIEFEKRLIEEFREFGKEICDNNKDDNENGEIDCNEGQCGGKICGWTELSETTAEVADSEAQNIQNSSNQEASSNELLNQSPSLTGNIISEEASLQSKENRKTPMYCINKNCQLKEEIIKEKIAVCGNHICEENETESCVEDCAKCPQHLALECRGKVIFKGKDKNNCPLEPICLEENNSCGVNEDCIQPLCGKAECSEGRCKVIALEECRELECVDGDEKVMNCESGEKIVEEKCIDGARIKTGIKCEFQITPPPETPTEQTLELSTGETIVGNECTAREDCGGENDVCSNGKCVTIPQREEVVEEKEEVPTTEQPTEQTPLEPTQPPAPESASAPEPSQQPTGAIIFAFFRSLLQNLKITGAAITGFQVEEPPTQSSSEAPPPEQQAPPQGQLPELQPGQPPYQEQAPPQEQQDVQRPREEGDRRMEQENKERCKKECTRLCTEKCTREKCGEKIDCNVDETLKACEQECKPDDSCIEKCMKGGDWWQEFQEPPKQEKGVFQVGGSCRTSQGKTEGFIWFGGWGEPFEKIQYLKQKYYSGGQADWCKQDFENLKKRRKAFEQGFNQEFVTWFFEKYLANSAEDWEQQTSGIFEIYWNNVDTIREMVFRAECLDEELNEAEFSLINVNYSTEYGSLEFWEEMKTVKMPGLDKEVEVITPYMKVWIFPPKSFIIYEMKKAMKEHEFPGKPEDKAERKNEEGPTAQEKEMIKQDEKFMKKIKDLSDKYGGSLDAVIQFKDYEKNEIVFNLYVQVNENDIIKMKPMLPEEVPAEDVRAEVDFEKIYDMIYFSEKEMRGAFTESPPWDRKSNPIGKIKDTVNGVKMYFKVRSLMNSAKITPEESASDLKSLAKTFFFNMQKSERKMPDEKEMREEMQKGEAENIKEDVLGSKEEITGEIVRD